MRASNLRLVSEPASTPESAVDRLVTALAKHGFQANPVHADFCDGDDDDDDDGKDTRPCIPVFRFSGEGHQQRLTDLLLEFYDSTEVPRGGHEPDTKLRVDAFDHTVDSELEFDFELQFNGAESIATLPRELFELTPKLGRSIKKRYCAKLSRFADFLENRPATA